MDDRRPAVGRSLTAAWWLALRGGLGPALLLAATGCRGRHEGPGVIASTRLPETVLVARTNEQSNAQVALGVRGNAQQILFGDLHVHTTFSIDAFGLSLPVMQGEGAHPPADACDFARHCSALDFWSINDHAEGLTPEHWAETKESIRRCNATAGDPENPDVSAFLGWEWSQVGETAETHYGHKNVVLRDIDEDRVPKRPIAAPPRLLAPFRQERSLWQKFEVPLRDFANRQRYLDFGRFQRELSAVPVCPKGVPTGDLPANCHEVAATPAELFRKLEEWGFENLVIPHGTTWGLYSPPGTSMAKQLDAEQHDPRRQRLFEIYSGHGNSEEFRDWAPFHTDGRGEKTCPSPRPDYLPCCWQAGEIVRSRCGDVSSEQCETRVETARRNYINAGLSGHLTVPGATLEDWKDCGQCRDCFNPAFNLRPLSSAQYALAIGRFGANDDGPSRFRFGFIGSSDVHSARPGTGYKEYGRSHMTEAAGPSSAAWRERFGGADAPWSPVSVAIDPSTTTIPVVRLWEGERQASFFMTGGLVAVHAEGRSRDAIWDALKRRTVYATSGDRILLWFDLLATHRGELPMGSEVVLKGDPTFRVKAVGAARQLPGCPDYARSGLPTERLERLCRGECYNPSEERRLVTRIEVVRIRPQTTPDEDVSELIEDPWRTFPCSGDPLGCVVTFTDEEFMSSNREALYYVRAMQEPTLAVNAGGLRCRSDEAGECLEVRPCYGDWRTSIDDDCLSVNEERAWSSPIFVTPAGPQGATGREHGPP